MGHNYVIGKVKGIRTAYERLFDIVKDTVEGQEHPTIYLGQGYAQEGVDYFTKRFQEELHATVIPYYIGPIIGICCGPGILHIVCKGKEMNSSYHLYIIQKKLYLRRKIRILHQVNLASF